MLSFIVGLMLGGVLDVATMCLVVSGTSSNESRKESEKNDAP